MNVLLLTRNSNVLREHTEARAAVEEYASFAKRLVVIVLNGRRDRAEPRKISPSLWLIPVNAWSEWLAPLLAVLRARRELFFQGRLQADLIASLDPCASGLAGALVSKQYGRPLHILIERNVFSPYFWTKSLGNGLRAVLARFVVRAADALRVQSEGIRAGLAGISPLLAGRAVVVPRFLDVEAIRREPANADIRAKYPQFNIVILVASPLTASYNVGLAISVLDGVLARYGRAGLVVVGEGPERRRLARQARRLRIADRVIFEGWSGNLSSYYKTAHLLLVPSLSEAYEDSIERAAASGCAIVSSRVGIAPSIIEQGVSGFLCDPGEPSSFVSAILAMIKNPALRERVKINGQLAVEKMMEGDKNRYLALCKRSWEAAIAARAPAV